MTITDHRVRAAVWHGTAAGEWRVEVYYAARRGRRVSVVLRADLDGDLSTEPVRRSFPDRLEALDWAAGIVWAMRRPAPALPVSRPSTLNRWRHRDRSAMPAA